MKQVTIDNVRERIAELEMVHGHGELSLRGEFELACLRMLADSMGGVDDDVRNVVTLLENNEWAEHCTKTVLGSRLEGEITRLVGSVQPAPEVYNIGDATMRHIFTPTGMANVSDMQAVFDRVETVLAGMEQLAPVAHNADPSFDGMIRALDAFYADDDVPERAMLAAFRILLADVRNKGHQEPATDNTARQFEALATSQAKPTAALKIPEGLHPDTADLVMRFATALAEKLHHAEQKYGHANGWKAPGWYNECLQQLWEHIEKGDPRDVAAYCAFMWHHGWVTTDYDRGVQQALATSAGSGKP